MTTSPLPEKGSNKAIDNQAEAFLLCIQWPIQSSDNVVLEHPAATPVDSKTAPHTVDHLDDTLSSLSNNGIFLVLSGSPTCSGIGETALTVDADKLLALYQQYGSDCAAHLYGCWAFVIADSKLNRVLVATDRMARRTIYYAYSPNGVSISTDLRRLKGNDQAADILDQSLYNYVYFHMIPSPDTLYKDIYKLNAGNILELTDGKQTLKRYWNPQFNEGVKRSAKVEHSELRNVLRQSVQRCVTGSRRVGAFLSGGLDSSTVAGMLSEVQGGHCDAYAIGFDAPGYDEMEYARITAQHFGITLHEYYVTPDDVVSALPDVAAASAEPFGNSSALPAYFCARMASTDGIDSLLAGDGGDELFAGNTRYAKQKSFAQWQKIPGWLRRACIELPAQSLPASMPLITKARNYITQANTPLPDRLQFYSFLETNDPSEVFRPALLASVDPGRPLELLGDIYHTPEQASELNRMLFMDWQITLADNDLRKVNQACELAGIDVYYPMLDDHLTEFSTGIASRRKLPGRQLRKFYKDALQGWLPDATINKSKQGFGLPFGIWMKEHKPLQELAYDNIEKLGQRRIFNREFLEIAIQSHRKGHAAYFGELIWVLATLELWLAANQPDYRHE